MSRTDRLQAAVSAPATGRDSDGDSVGSDAALSADYAARSLTIGSRVRALLPGGNEIVGDARSVDDQGRLCIATGDGTVAVSAGDIVHLRPIDDGGFG